ncbi:MAG: DUF3224 domain-containing protein [Pseudomonadota bacterium]
MKPFDTIQKLGRLAASHHARRQRQRESNPYLNAIGELIPVQGIQGFTDRFVLPLHHEYKGDLQATGQGEIILRQRHDSVVDYVAVEEVHGKLHDLSGGFTVIHQGRINAENSVSRQRLFIQSGSGTGQLSGLIGGIELIERLNSLLYKLNYRI